MLIHRFKTAPAMVLGGLFLILFPALLSALLVREYDPARHDRLVDFSTNPSLNDGFFLSQHDFSGVGWEPDSLQRHFPLVSPVHILGANHFVPGVGLTVRFINGDGVVAEREVVALHRIVNDDGERSDLVVAELDEPLRVADGYAFFPYLNLPAESDYTGEDIIIAGRRSRYALGEIARFLDFEEDSINRTRAFEFSYNNFIGGDDDGHPESGDSGAPTFIVHNGRPAIVGSHTAIAETAVSVTSTDTFVPHFASTVNAKMEARGYHLTQAIPDVTSIALSALAVTTSAEQSFSLTLSIENTGAHAAHNLQVAVTVPDGFTVESVSAPGWVDDTSANGYAGLRGGLDAGAQSEIVLAMTSPATVGEFTAALTVTADGINPVVGVGAIAVLESFSTWAAGLDDRSPTGDDDGDALANLLEFAFGGDPETASWRRADGHAVLPRLEPIEDGGQVFAALRFLRRTDAETRGLAYAVEVTNDLVNGPWQTVAVGAGSIPVTETTASPPDGFADFEAVTVRFTEPLTADAGLFFRFSVVLDTPALMVTVESP